MRIFLANILLTIVWLILTGELTIGNLVFGYLICYFVLWVIFRKFEHYSYFKKGPGILNLIWYFFKQIVFTNLRIAYDLITPGNTMNPGIIRIKNQCESQIQVILFSNLVSLTPGTLVLEFEEDNKSIFVHLLYLKNEVQAKEELYTLQNKVKIAIK